MVCGACERTNWERMWEIVTERKWEKIEKLREMLTVVGLKWECSHKRLYDVGDKV